MTAESDHRGSTGQASGLPSIDVVADVDAPGKARRAVSEWFPDHSRRIDLLLVISEIVTNAVRHGPGQGSIGMEVVSRAPVRLVVHHPGRERIAGRMPDDDSIRQGLMIVDRLSDRWGIELSEDRIGVWFELG